MNEELVNEFQKKFDKMLKDYNEGLILSEELQEFVHAFLDSIKVKIDTDRLQAIADAELDKLW